MTDQVKSSRAMLVVAGMTFTIAVVALLLHLRSLITTPALSVPTETLGERLQRECESVVDTADVTISPIEVFMELEYRPDVKPELSKIRYMPDKIDYLKEKRPDVWQAGIRETIVRKRAKMIRDCVIQRGTAGR